MKYLVRFEDICKVLNADELLNFVSIAVINNKDISSFSVCEMSKASREELIKALANE